MDTSDLGGGSFKYILNIIGNGCFFMVYVRSIQEWLGGCALIAVKDRTE